ncbi:FAD/NAD(P)-binding protein [Pseudogemmobacter humi]|uniref:Bifunctional tRNA (Mnm(5)s(2)U34)-methyltransferase/FAD-dependent cmnm(5)s(2)U34 oxidoreductase n=1 Tax=Pseudogemmobacter humi TaxID=2483812 RepID=A0A3P5WY61_9RHOB|nr:FAD-dependent oxidoreductase [Pseudogemmobacter humi]VDC19882.1 bifunctional tRNA (mnm(5)s(2)U34)-methyltransferase/FAD-dependent cmnm(5)s(2)U34 oxidoreductase [Pseudogemmobacter humi]
MTEHRPVIASGSHENRHVVIVGGGLSGAAVAWHLAKNTGESGPRITLIEPRAEPGRGLAYSTPDPDHRLNVPHVRMTLDISEPDHYARWLASGAAPQFPDDAVTETGAIFTPRAVFGAYVFAHLQPYLATGRITHLQSRARSASREGGVWRIRLEDGRPLTASDLVLAASHPAPGLPQELAALAGDAGLIADAYAPGALDGVGAAEEVVILGSGLTGADIVASLVRRGHQGRVRLLSRSGRRSQPHGPEQAEASADFTIDPAVTAAGLLRRIRAELAIAAADGLTWHPVFDRLRSQGPLIWAALPLNERRRLVRHLRGLWDIHRFRIAPQTHASLLAAEASGQVEAIAGRIIRAARAGDRLRFTLRLRRGGEADFAADRVILATGPAHGAVTKSNPFYADLARQGLIKADALSLGIAATAEGQAIDASDKVQPDLYIAGPLARAAVGELMGVPEVTAWAEKIAALLAKAPARV